MKRAMIIGCPRSGTTLLQKLLSMCPEVYAPQETAYFDFLFKNFPLSILDNIYISRKRFLGWKDHVVKNDILDCKLDDIKCMTKKEIISHFVNIMDYNAQKNKKSFWVEKTPGHILKIRHIERYLPRDMKYVHIIRNPQDVVASLVRVGREFPEKWPRYASINRSISFVNRCLKESERYIGRGNHYFFSYERLVDSPSEELKKVLSFLGIIIDSSVMEYMVNNFEESTSGRKVPWVLGYGNEILKNRNQKFYELFSKNEQQYIKQKIDSDNKVVGQFNNK